MSTKDNYDCLKEKEKPVIQDRLNDQFNNLNLNQNNKRCVEDFSSNNVNNIKEKPNYGFSHNNDLQTTQASSLFGQTKLNSSFANLNAQKDYGKKEVTKGGNGSNAKNSTLALHVSAYENSIDANSLDPNNDSLLTTKEKDLMKNWKKIEKVNKSKEALLVFNSPRQIQHHEVKEADNLEFKVSQRLWIVDDKQAEQFDDWHKRIWSTLKMLSPDFKSLRRSNNQKFDFYDPIYIAQYVRDLKPVILKSDFDDLLFDEKYSMLDFRLRVPEYFVGMARQRVNEEDDDDGDEDNEEEEDFDPRARQNMGRNEAFFNDLAELYYSPATRNGELFVVGGSHVPDINKKRKAAWQHIYEQMLQKNHKLTLMPSFQTRWRRFVKATIEKHLEVTSEDGPSRNFTAGERLVIRHTTSEALHGIGSRDLGVPTDGQPITNRNRSRLVNSETPELSQRTSQRFRKAKTFYTPTPPRNMIPLTPERLTAAIASTTSSTTTWSRKGPSDPDYMPPPNVLKRIRSQQQTSPTSTKRFRVEQSSESEDEDDEIEQQYDLHEEEANGVEEEEANGLEEEEANDAEDGENDAEDGDYDEEDGENGFEDDGNDAEDGDYDEESNNGKSLTPNLFDPDDINSPLGKQMLQ